MPKRRHRDRSNTPNCPVEAALNVIGGKWKAVILVRLAEGTKRFNELGRLLPNTTQRMLTNQLRELEADGLVARKVYAQVPPKVEYSLTPLGRTLEPVLRDLAEWSEAHIMPTLPPRPEQPPADEETGEQPPATV